MTADFTSVRLAQAERDVVQVARGSGTARTETLEATIGYRTG